MSRTILVKIITPSHMIFESEAQAAIMAGEDGEFGVLPKHMLLIANLKPGFARISTIGKEHKFFVYGGIAQVTGEQVNIVTEFAVNVENVVKTKVIDTVVGLKKLLEQEADAQKIQDLNQSLVRQESLLSFL